MGSIRDRPAGLEPDQLIQAHGLAVDSRGDIYAGDVSLTTRGRRGPVSSGLRSLQKPVEARRRQEAS